MPVVTVTDPAVTVTATPSGSSHAASGAPSPGSIAGIVIGVLLGTALIVFLVLYLVRRHRRHRFTRVPNPLPGPLASSAGAPRPSRASSRKAQHHFPRHLQRPSLSSEPLIAPVSWPPIPPTSRVHSPSTPSRSNSTSPAARESRYSIGEVTQVVSAGPVSRSVAPAILNIPPARRPGQSSPSPKSQQTFFVHRMLQSRAQASEAFSPAHHPPLDSTQSRSTTLDSSAVRADQDQQLADAERTALRDAGRAQDNGLGTIPGEGESQDMTSTESVYSQNSAPLDHSTPSRDPASRENSTLSVNHRKSSRRQARTTELTPVAEMPDTPRMFEARSDTSSFAANSSLDGQISHGTASRRMSSVLDAPGTLPLLTSATFGKDSATSDTPAGSISSTAAWGSHSSGRASRYPSIAPSSIGPSVQSESRSDGGTDWRHPPPGLSGLKTLRIGPLRNPHSPVEEYPEQPDASSAAGTADPALAQRPHARLRQGTTSSVPEVERRSVMGSGIARIDVAL